MQPNFVVHVFNKVVIETKTIVVQPTAQTDGHFSKFITFLILFT